MPQFGRRLAYPANRTGVSACFTDPSVRKSIDVDLALLERYDALITDLELTIVRDAKRHDGDAFHRLRSVPGIGKVLEIDVHERDVVRIRLLLGESGAIRLLSFINPTQVLEAVSFFTQRIHAKDVATGKLREELLEKS